MPEEEIEVTFINDITFKKEEDAFEWFYSERDFINFCKEKNVWFDGRRYFWHFKVKDGMFYVGERVMPGED